MAAKELAERGFEVLVLEAGPPVIPERDLNSHKAPFNRCIAALALPVGRAMTNGCRIPLANSATTSTSKTPSILTRPIRENHSCDETARMLHGLYCYVVDALYGERTDEKLASAALGELNRVFAG